MSFTIDNRFINALPADDILENYPRQVKQAYSFVTPKQTAQPALVHVSSDMLKELGLSHSYAQSNEFLQLMTGNAIYPQTKPYAMNYAGHQFGHWAGQLGDGRAINLFETSYHGKHWVLQLKGAGPTPYSRSGDGLAVLRSSIREYLCSEAMHHLGIPTTRSLSLALTGDKVLRDMLYDGNPEYETGAIVCRVAPSFLRFGSYQLFAAQQNKEALQQLIDHTLQVHFPHIKAKGIDALLQWFQEITDKTCDLMVHWQRVGFVHGVMNTDNMSILGLTIDYGPYGWLEPYNKAWTPNTTDKQQRRYRYGWQPKMAQWNLVQLANALFFLTDEATALESILMAYEKQFKEKYLVMMRRKLGLFLHMKDDQSLLDELEKTLQCCEVDFTIFFRELSSVNQLTKNPLQTLKKAFYHFESLTLTQIENWQSWLKKYTHRLSLETKPQRERLALMHATNPKYIFRNYMAQLAIDKANKGDYSLIDTFYQLLKSPYKEQIDMEEWYVKRPEWARTKVGCSMLSCSS